MEGHGGLGGQRGPDTGGNGADCAICANVETSYSTLMKYERREDTINPARYLRRNDTYIY
jgi:hypothetical protein